MGTQEHVKTPKRTAGTHEYIKMGASKINPLRIVQCRSYIHDTDVGKRESETERERERERKKKKFSFGSKVEQRVMLICHYFVHIVKINYIFICTSLSDI